MSAVSATPWNLTAASDAKKAFEAVTAGAFIVLDLWLEAGELYVHVASNKVATIMAVPATPHTDLVAEAQRMARDYLGAR